MGSPTKVDDPTASPAVPFINQSESVPRRSNSGQSPPAAGLPSQLPYHPSYPLQQHRKHSAGRFDFVAFPYPGNNLTPLSMNPLPISSSIQAISLSFFMVSRRCSWRPARPRALFFASLNHLANAGDHIVSSPRLSGRRRHLHKPVPTTRLPRSHPCQASSTTRRSGLMACRVCLPDPTSFFGETISNPQKPTPRPPYHRGRRALRRRAG